MKLNKLVYDIRESLKFYSNDNDIDDRYLTYLIGIKRSKFFRQELNNFQRTTDITSTQTLCPKLEEVSINQCNIDFDCETIVRTKDPIPKPLELHIKSALTSVRSTNRISVPFSFVTKERALYSMHSSFNNGIFAFLDNDLHIYFISKLDTLKLIECVTVTGVFEDPLALLNYTNCCGCNDASPCFDLDTVDYPLQPHYIDLIRGEIVQDLTSKFKIPEDNQNDSEDDEKS